MSKKLLIVLALAVFLNKSYGDFTDDQAEGIEKVAIAIITTRDISVDVANILTNTRNSVQASLYQTYQSSITTVEEKQEQVSTAVSESKEKADNLNIDVSTCLSREGELKSLIENCQSQLRDQFIYYSKWIVDNLIYYTPNIVDYYSIFTDVPKQIYACKDGDCLKEVLSNVEVNITSLNTTLHQYVYGTESTQYSANKGYTQLSGRIIQGDLVRYEQIGNSIVQCINSIINH